MPVPPTLPFVRETSCKRGGSHDLDRERSVRTHTPSPRSYTPRRPHSAQLSQQSQEERVPEGYVKHLVGDHEVFRLRQHLEASGTEHLRRHDEVMRRDVANQQLQRQQQQAHLELTEEMARRDVANQQQQRQQQQQHLELTEQVWRLQRIIEHRPEGEHTFTRGGRCPYGGDHTATTFPR